ncbi:hypothetical protein TNCV_3740201 [Trichonephila clavipes]|nr:hypothetical protein TNCV_3740201 [Trichonephila clavipes]
MSSLSKNAVYNHLKAEESKLLGLPTSSKIVKKITLTIESFIHGSKSTRLKQHSTIQFDETIRQQIRLEPNTFDILQEPQCKALYFLKTPKLEHLLELCSKKEPATKKKPQSQRNQNHRFILKKKTMFLLSLMDLQMTLGNGRAGINFTFSLGSKAKQFIQY